jgi:putative transposase
MKYRRAFVPGGNYFFTVVTERRQKIFIDDRNIEILRQAFKKVMEKYPFSIDAAVILPEHLHFVWTLPPNDTDFSTRWRLIKTWFTKHCEYKSMYKPNVSQIKRGEKTIWQHRYWEHLLQDELDFEQHVNYIHYNPVKHGYVSKPVDWKYSSFHKYIEQGLISSDWGKSEVSFSDDIGNE